MRLRRIEAARYGALVDATLGDLGDGLTVVLGPNEAGKSTFTSLVRHVLYRYPTAREVEPGYAVAGLGRLARLVFDDGAGTWVVERGEGVHGGKVSVRAIAGPERPSLLEDITRGVSEHAYRTVFGFGLGEMAAIEERSEGDSVIDRLYAASAGLRVSPQEVRAGIDAEAGELFKSSARKPVVNTLIAAMRGTRASLRELRAETESFVVEHERLAEMETKLEAARAVRDAARERCLELAVAVERATERQATIASAEEALASARRERKRMADEIESLQPDEALRAAAPELDALVDEAAGHAHALQALAERESELLRAETRADDALARAGLDAPALDLLGDVHASAAAIEEARDDLQRLQLVCAARAEALQRAVDAREQADAVAARMLDEHRIDGEGLEAIAERLDALDALEGLRGGGPGLRRADVLPAVILLVCGVVAMGTGAFLQSWVNAAIGILLVFVGAAVALRARRGAVVLPDGTERRYLVLLGLGPSDGALEVSRKRRSLEAARTAVVAARDAACAAEDAQRDVALACESLETRRQLWAAWLAAHGMDVTLAPGAAAAQLASAREAQAARAAAGEARTAYEHAVEQLDSFAARFSAAVGPYLPVTEPFRRADVAALGNRVRERLTEVRAGVARRDELVRAMGATDAQIAADSERLERARAEILEVLERFDLAESGSEALRVMQGSADHEVREATAAFDELAMHRSQLDGKLETGARERRGGELHLEEAGLGERLAEAVDRYLVLAVAARLLASAQERYARERQPDVVRTASRLFTAMTGGRYVDLSVPLDDGRIEVFDARAEARTSDVLSRGTAEQLYLAIRLGLITELGDVGTGLPVLMDDVLVNFDPVRRRGAAEAIAGLASGRQVIFFTCHPDTADLFSDVAPDHVRIDIPRIGA